MMKIKRIEIYPVILERKEVFRIATGATKNAHNVLIKILTDDGIEGWGNACPNSVTGETTSSIQKAIKILSKFLIGQNPLLINKVCMKIDEKLNGNPSAKAGIDIALYDILGKFEGMPTYKLLGACRNKIPTDITIGIMDLEKTVAHAKLYKKQGFKALKLKVGLNLKKDLKRITAVSRVVGNNFSLRIDCNQGFDVKTAKKFIRTIHTLETNIEFIEQPIAVKNLKGLKELAKISKIPIMADESVRSYDDAVRFVKRKNANLLNIKLIKFGGLSKALRINKMCESAGINTMVGCYGESLCSIVAGLHFALSQKNVKFADLDSQFSFKKDVTSDGYKFERGYLIPSKKLGFGTKINL